MASVRKLSRSDSVNLMVDFLKIQGETSVDNIHSYMQSRGCNYSLKTIKQRLLEFLKKDEDCHVPIKFQPVFQKGKLPNYYKLNESHNQQDLYIIEERGIQFPTYKFKPKNVDLSKSLNSVVIQRTTQSRQKVIKSYRRIYTASAIYICLVWKENQQASLNEIYEFLSSKNFIINKNRVRGILNEFNEFNNNRAYRLFSKVSTSIVKLSCHSQEEYEKIKKIQGFKDYNLLSE